MSPNLQLGNRPGYDGAGGLRFHRRLLEFDPGIFWRGDGLTDSHPALLEPISPTPIAAFQSAAFPGRGQVNPGVERSPLLMRDHIPVAGSDPAMP